MTVQMNVRRKNTEAAERFAERRRREEAAPRLRERVPELTTLRLEVEELTDSIACSKHVRHIVVERAPALFVLPCGDPSCKGGGYEITDSVMHGLRSHAERFEADDRCLGSTGNASCRRSVHVIALATYSK